MIELVISVITAALVHEGGHFTVALCFGYVIHFCFAWGRLWKIPIPRGVWTMPNTDRWKQRVIALAGFGAEFLAVPIFYVLAREFWVWYALVVAVHMVAYRWYAGEASDWRWL